jgi:hypothetical protein
MSARRRPGKPGTALDDRLSGGPDMAPTPPSARRRPGKPGTALDDVFRSWTLSGGALTCRGNFRVLGLSNRVMGVESVARRGP